MVLSGYIIILLSRIIKAKKRQILKLVSFSIKKSGFYNKEWHVITAGCSTPINCKIVGAISPKTPF